MRFAFCRLIVVVVFIPCVGFAQANSNQQQTSQESTQVEPTTQSDTAAGSPTSSEMVVRIPAEVDAGTASEEVTTPEVAAEPETPQPDAPAQAADEPAATAQAPPAPSAPEAPAKPLYMGPLAGTLTYRGPPVVQHGEIVFDHLPPTRLRLLYDTNAWDARLLPGTDGMQKVVLRSLKRGTQKKCVVRWMVVP